MAGRIVFTTILLVGFALLVPLHASAQESGDDWKYSIGTYLWFPSVNGDLNYESSPSGGGSPGVSIDSGSTLGDFNFGNLSLTGTARKGRWVIGTDVIYLDISDEKSDVPSVDFNPGSGPINIATTDLNADTKNSLTSWVWTMAGGYTVVQKPKLNLDVIGGFRYFGLDTETKWKLKGTVTGTGSGGNTATFSRNGKVKQSEDIWTGIVGARGHYRLGEGGWFTNFYGDIGGGSSTFTWQGLAGIAYAFHWGNVLLDYRYLYYDQDDDELVDDLSFGGLALGINFEF
jgi:hypothetical protein